MEAIREKKNLVIYRSSLECGAFTRHAAARGGPSFYGYAFDEIMTLSRRKPTAYAFGAPLTHIERFYCFVIHTVEFDKPHCLFSIKNLGLPSYFIMGPDPLCVYVKSFSL